MSDAALTPYSQLPPRAFWRTGVADVGLFGLGGLWASKWILPADARFSTYGSCFAQHISRAMVARKVNWFCTEPAPGRTPAKLVEAYNYGVFSARTGNIYTAAQLLILTQMATGEHPIDGPEFWPDGKGFRCSLRPVIEPVPFADLQDALLSRAATVRAFRRSFAEAEVFIFTLGLTEGWENAATGQPYALCPGTVAGQFDAAQHVFRNYTYPEIRSQLEQAFALMRAVKPTLKILLTVSPVPLTATASGDHVLVATTYSKSTLRAVAGDLARDPDIDYFPSYEIITGAPTRSAFYEPNLRSVVKAGVDVVMGHFFAGLNITGPAQRGAAPADPEAEVERQMEADDLVCEEMMLEQFNGG